MKFGYRLRGGSIAAEQTIDELDFGDEKIALSPKDWVILAVPPWVAQEMVPELVAPTEFRGIANVHYRVEVPCNMAGFTGLIGGLAEWVFVKPGLVSVTISASDRYNDADYAAMPARVWRDLARLFDLDPAKVPPYRVVREKHATFPTTPEQNRRPPRSYTASKHLAPAAPWP